MDRQARRKALAGARGEGGKRGERAASAGEAGSLVGRAFGSASALIGTRDLSLPDSSTFRGIVWKKTGNSYYFAIELLPELSSPAADIEKQAIITSQGDRVHKLNKLRDGDVEVIMN